MSMNLATAAAAVLLAGATASAATITVNPSGGVAGQNPTNSILDALAQVNAGTDAVNTIVLARTLHTIPAGTFTNMRNPVTVNFVQASGVGQAVIRPTATGNTTPMWFLAGSDYTVSASFTDIHFVPPTGLAYAAGINKALRFGTMDVTFNNCVFSYNSGTNTAGSLEGATNYAASNHNVGDTWIELWAANGTFSNCTVTGANGDGIVLSGGSARQSYVTLTNGTVVANNGGNGVATTSLNANAVLNGTGGRIQLVRNGYRTGANGAGLKLGSNLTGTSCQITRADILGNAESGIADRSGMALISITESRIALNNTADVFIAGNLSISDPSNLSNYPSTINISRSTFHDAVGASAGFSIYITSNSSGQTHPTWNISDSVFSGAGDAFAMLNNNTVAVNKSHTAVVTSGPHAIGFPAFDLGSGSPNTDPGYVSLSYTIGRNQANPNFLLPGAAGYATASSTGGRLAGGSPGILAAVGDWNVY